MVVVVCEGWGGDMVGVGWGVGVVMGVWVGLGGGCVQGCPLAGRSVVGAQVEAKRRQAGGAATSAWRGRAAAISWPGTGKAA